MTVHECEECGLVVDLDGNGLTVSDYSQERHFCSHVCAVHYLTSEMWNALLDAIDPSEDLKIGGDK